MAKQHHAPKRIRRLSYPRAYSVMISNRSGQAVDALRVIDSTETYRASMADVTRRLILKGMAVEAAELAMSFETGHPAELTTSLLKDVARCLGKGRVRVPEELDEALWLVLTRMWPELTEAIEAIEKPNTTEGKNAISSLEAGAPLTAKGRTLTAEEIRAEAMRELVAGRVEAPKLLPPRNVQEARARARLESAADRLAIDRGVPAEVLLAQTGDGRLAGLATPDESSGTQGWTGRDGHGGHGEAPGAANPHAQRAAIEGQRAGRVRRQVPAPEQPKRRGR